MPSSFFIGLKPTSVGEWVACAAACLLGGSMGLVIASLLLVYGLALLPS